MPPRRIRSTQQLEFPYAIYACTSARSRVRATPTITIRPAMATVYSHCPQGVLAMLICFKAIGEAGVIMAYSKKHLVFPPAESHSGGVLTHRVTQRLEVDWLDEAAVATTFCSAPCPLRV